MKVQHIDAVAVRGRQHGRSYLEIVRVPALSAGVYQLPAGGDDRQDPHTEDEIYYVVSGRARLEIDGEEHPVEGGSIAFVPAGARHRFREISEPLTLLVVFGPAEYARAAGS
jgi:mannose-6-phosphate isomerase-like protein (cupin superfamily)